MNRQSVTQLEKVLALADSNHDGEAIVAVRKARQMLSRDGLCFSDLARAAGRKSIHLPFSFFNETPAHVQGEIVHLRLRLEHLQTELETQDAQTLYWKQRATELEQKLNHSQTEAQRWRQLARDTVDKLWDLGQSIQHDESTTEEPASKTA